MRAAGATGRYKAWSRKAYQKSKQSLKVGTHDKERKHSGNISPTEHTCEYSKMREKDEKKVMHFKVIILGTM